MTLEDLKNGRGRREMAESGTEGFLEGVKDFVHDEKEERTSGDGRRGG